VIDRKLYKGSFDKNQMNNNWNCPRCNAGILHFHEDKVFKEVDADTQAWEKNDPTSFHWQFCSSYVYTTLLVCSNKECNEKVICSGTSCVDIYDNTEDNDGNIENLYETYYKPLFFYPALHFFDIPKDTSEEVKENIIKSFNTFFSDYESSANSLRIALEYIINELNENTELRKLHKKIENLDSLKYDKIRDKCMALKWLGNDGSHCGSQKMTSDDVLDGYDLLSFILNTLYTTTSHIEEITTKVNSNKGISRI